MRRWILNSATGIVFLIVATSVGAAAEPAAKKVLWVGNSYSGNYIRSANAGVYTPVQKRVNQACPDFQIDVEACLKGGANMKDHFEKKEKNPLEWIKTKKYDIVLLQGGATLFKDDRKEIFREYMPKFIEAAKESGARVILAGTWSTGRSVETTQVQIDIYREAFKKFDVAYVPVGEAWKTVLTEKPDWGMYVDTTGHPSALGIYLNICVYYAVFSGKSPVGLNEDVPDWPMDEKNIPAFKEGKFMTLDADTKAYMEKVAWDTVQPYIEHNTRILRGAGPS